jgi:hypothetical protein
VVDPDSPKRAERIVAWLQRINGQHAAIMRWLASGGIIYGGVTNNPAMISAFIGLASLTLVVGKQ